MKSAYELAMERLQAEDPDSTPALSDEQREEIAEISKRYQAKIAEREIFLNKQLVDARSKGEFNEIESIGKQIASEKARLEEEMEAEKEKVRNRSKS